MESTGRFGEQRAEDGDDGENRPAWAFTARPQGESFRYAREVDGVRAFIDPGAASLMGFLTSVGTVRSQLRALVHKAEKAGQTFSDDESYLGDLRSTYRQLGRLQQSPLAWHDVHGGDAELMRKAENLLWQASSRRPLRSRV